MKTQDELFLDFEGDAWFRRNAMALGNEERFDWPISLATRIAPAHAPKTVAELGCANGWRLEMLARTLGSKWIGVDASTDAIADGRARFPKLDLRRGELARLPVREDCDLVIVNFVLHWVDRSLLAAVISEIDRIVVDRGWLIIGDFLPDWQQRCPYHHLPDRNVFTYKQDYARIFTALGAYRECARITYDHSLPSPQIVDPPAVERATCVLLQKSRDGYYACA